MSKQNRLKPKLIAFRVDGTPAPQVRPKVGNGHGYYDEDSIGALQCIAWREAVSMQATVYRPRKLLDTPLKVKMVFHVPRPKNRKNAKLPCWKPDLDNYIKAVSDSLEGIIYTNDSRIVSLEAVKIYSQDPHLYIRIEEIEEGK